MKCKPAAKLYPPEEMVTEIWHDPVTGDEIEVTAWRHNTLKFDAISLGPGLEAVPDLRLPTQRTVDEICRRLLGSEDPEVRLVASVMLGIQMLQLGRPKVVELRQRDRAIARYVKRQVARGEKQEAAVAAAKVRFGCKRSTVMKALAINVPT